MFFSINRINKFLTVTIFFILNNLFCIEDTNLIKSLSKTGNHKVFIDILEKNPLFLSLINNTIQSTIYAPTDKAFSLMPEEFIKKIKSNNIKYTTKVILTHIFSGDSLEANKDEGLALSIDGSLYYTYKSKDLFVKDIVTQGKFFKVDNFTVIPVECVMYLQQSTKDYRLDKSLQEKYRFTHVVYKHLKNMKHLRKTYNHIL